MTYKRFFASTLLMLMSVVFAQAGTGNSCEDPILLTKDYKQTIHQAGAVWYIANTFDLPLAIDFYPVSEADEIPDLELDFGCTPGKYDDPIICSLFCAQGSSYLTLPHREKPKVKRDAQNRVYYHVEFGKTYRDMLLRQGIDYNVEVYVKAIFYGGGELTMDPDPFGNCMEYAKFMHLGDTVQVKAYDMQRHVIAPYVQWQYESIRYQWEGTKPCHFGLSSICDFDPMDNSDEHLIDLAEIQPGEYYEVDSKVIKGYVTNPIIESAEAGVYFAKFYSEASGVMTIEKVPVPAPQDEAILLEIGQQAELGSNDTITRYAIPETWTTALQFTTPTDHVFRMYVGKTPDFLLKEAVATYQFDKTEDGHALYLFEADVTKLWKNKVADDHYLYVRFECTAGTTILPDSWTPAGCITEITRIEPGVQFNVANKSSVIYGLYYEEWKAGDMSLAWTGAAPCTFYIADTCQVPNSNTAPVFYSGTIPKNTSTTCGQDVVASWAQYVDQDGYIYIRFYSNAKAKITVSTTAPEEQDPDSETPTAIDQTNAPCRARMQLENGKLFIVVDDKTYTIIGQTVQ